jgi:hypothetical protein
MTPYISSSDILLNENINVPLLFHLSLQVWTIKSIIISIITSLVTLKKIIP